MRTLSLPRRLTSAQAVISFLTLLLISVTVLAELGPPFSKLLLTEPNRSSIFIDQAPPESDLGSNCNPINSGVTYSENFNSLAITGTSTTLPQGWLFSEAGTSGNTTYSAGTGSGAVGDTFSYGAALNSDRAFGGLQTGSLVPTVGACFVNNTGSQVSILNIAYDGEQWRLGAFNRVDRLDFEFSLDATSLTTGTWTAVDALDFTAPVTTAPTTGALDGNINKTARSGNISDIALAPGATIFIRYVDFNASSSDDGLAIDNFTLSAGNGTPSIQFSAATYLEDESQMMNVTVTRTGASGTSSVDYLTGGGDATPGACGSGGDYEPGGGTLTFAGLEDSKIISIPICPDLLPEVPETFAITLSNPTNATLGSPSMAMMTINDAATQFTNTSAIAVVDDVVTSSTLSVAGAPNSIGKLRVTLFDINDDLADDLNLVLVSPAGQAFVLMADSGGSNGVGPGVTLTFNDDSPDFLPDSTPIMSGSFKPTSWSPTPTILPGSPPPPYSESGPGGGRSQVNLNTVFGGQSANGMWTLYVYGDNGTTLGSRAPGTIAGGWGLETFAPTAIAASVSGRVLDAGGNGIRNVVITIEGGDLPSPRTALTGSFGHYSFDSLSPGTYMLTVSAKRHSFAAPSRVIGIMETVAGIDFVAQALE